MVSVALCLIAIALPARSLSQTPSNPDARELLRLEDVWNQAQISGDAEALDRLWADDLEVAIPHMPVMTRAEVLAFARSGHMKFLRYETSDLHVRVYGDAAVVSGRLLRARAMNGNQIADDWRFTKVYIRQGHEWRVVSFQASDSPAL